MTTLRQHTFPARCLTWALLLGLALTAFKPSKLYAQGIKPSHSNTETRSAKFDMQSLRTVPRVESAAEVPNQGLQAIFFDSVPYQGQPTKVFAYYGLPTGYSDASAQTAKVPGVVLIHGGGGTAFANWVKLWNDRGYAAIAMDLCGCVPLGTYGNWQRHAAGGPPGWDASFDQINQPSADQWQTHAISAVCLAHSLLASLPEVDADRIGVTGISWGGYMTCLIAGIDSRFRCAAPVYGCGYLGENSAWLPAFKRLGKQSADRWLAEWDPAQYLPQADMPFLWVNGTNDFAYPMDSWQRSIDRHTGHPDNGNPDNGNRNSGRHSLTTADSKDTLCLRIRMPHGHGAAGENPEEIHVFMNSILKFGKPLPVMHEPKLEGTQVKVSCMSQVPLVKAELCYTLDSGAWQERHWEALAAKLGPIPPSANPTTPSTDWMITAELPPMTKVWYVNVFDDRNCVVSTRHSLGR